MRTRMQTDPGNTRVYAGQGCVNDKTGLKHDHVRDHGIVSGVGVLGDVEILLDHPARVGQERPVGADSAAIFIGFSDIVGADRHQPAIADLELAMEFDKPFRLPAVFRTVAAAAEDENHRMRPLQFGEFSTFRGVVGKLVVGENSPWDHVGSHLKSSTISSSTPTASTRQCRPASCANACPSLRAGSSIHQSERGRLRPG
jgi:hypothetical protein